MTGSRYDVAERARFVAQLGDGTDYDAEDARQRAEEQAAYEAWLAQAEEASVLRFSPEVCDHVHVTVEIVETCECGEVLHRAKGRLA